MQPALPSLSSWAPLPAAGTAPLPTTLLLVSAMRAKIRGVGRVGAPGRTPPHHNDDRTEETLSHKSKYPADVIPGGARRDTATTAAQPRGEVVPLRPKLLTDRSAAEYCARSPSWIRARRAADTQARRQDRTPVRAAVDRDRPQCRLQADGLGRLDRLERRPKWAGEVREQGPQYAALRAPSDAAAQSLGYVLKVMSVTLVGGDGGNLPADHVFSNASRVANTD